MRRVVTGTVLAAALVAGVIAPGCNMRRGIAAQVRGSAIGAFPRESVALMVLEVKKIRALRPDVPWLKNLGSLAGREGGPLQEINARLGPEALERLDRLSVAVVPRGDGLVGYGILAEGSFDRDKIRESLGGQDLLTLFESGKMDFTAALLSDGSLALGPKSVLETMRTNQGKRGAGLDDNAAILRPLERVRPEAQIWGAFDCKGLQKIYKDLAQGSDLAALPLQGAPVQALETVSFRGMVEDGIRLDLFGQAEGEKNARILADAARGLVALGRVGAGRDQAKEWLEFLDGIHIRQSGVQVDLDATIPAATMESFVGRMLAEALPKGPVPAASPLLAAPQAPSHSAVAPATPASPPVPHSQARPSRGGGAPPADSSPSPAPAGRDTQSPSASVP